MKLDDFKLKMKSYRRFEMLAGFAFFTLLLVASVPVLFIAKRIDLVGFDTTCIVVISVSFPVIGVLMFYALARLPQRRVRYLGLTCPTCSKRLIGAASQVVVATGHCGFCGSQVLEST